MALPSTKLDDKTFAQLAEDARKLIPRFAPGWTDYNIHDPGITFVELFSWLVETQQYYLDRIRDKNYLKFLKLLGAKPKEAVSAKAEVTFSPSAGNTRSDLIPKGTKLAADDIIFETKEPLPVTPVALEKVLTELKSGLAVDNTEANARDGFSYFAFGAEAEAGSRLYLGFYREKARAPFIKKQLISVTFNLFEDYPVPVGAHGNEETEIIPSASIAWEYYSTAGGGQWTALTPVRDNTGMLSGSGRIIFAAPINMSPSKVYPADDKERYWFRGTVINEGYELPPQIDSVIINTVQAGQQETLGEVISFSGSGEVNQFFVASSYLALKGHNLVQVRDREGRWQDWQEPDDFAASGHNDRHYKLKKNAFTKTVKLSFGNGKKGKIPPKGENNIRLVSFEPEAEDKCSVGKSNGLPGQSFSPGNAPLIPDTIVLQVGEETGDKGQGDLYWRDWMRVDDFDVSKPGDHHYVLNAETGEIIFGDGINGAIPPVLSDQTRRNIRLISCQACCGRKGNVPAEAINKLVKPLKGLGLWQVENRLPGTGGKEKETFEEARFRVRRNLQTEYSAVTSDDFERLACSTPGLRVARAKAIPLYTPDLQNYPAKKAPASVTVAVVPYTQGPRPLPGKGFLATVFHHLCKHRLITTELYVIPPDYVRIRVEAEVVIKARFNPAGTRQKIEEALNSFLHPLTGYAGNNGWPFGRTVYKSEIYQVIENIDGVDYINRVVLTANGTGISADVEGNIPISPISLVYSGEHQIEIAGPELKYRGKGGCKS